MNPCEKRKAISFDDAIETLVELYRRRLKEDPVVVAMEWAEHVDAAAIVDFCGDELLLLIDE